MATRSPAINVMVKAAMKATRQLLHDFNEVEQLQVSKKGPADFVSNADTAAEKTIVDELKYARRDYGFLLEEGSEIESRDELKRRWIIDPLDGTTNFLHGIPHFAISIALEEAGEIVSAVIYEPTRDELFWAEKGKGAYLNDRRLRVSARRNLEDSVFATGIPTLRGTDHAFYLKQLEAVMTRCSSVRRRARPRLCRGWPLRRLLGTWPQPVGCRRRPADREGSGRLLHRLPEPRQGSGNRRGRRRQRSGSRQAPEGAPGRDESLIPPSPLKRGPQLNPQLLRGI